jgi:hypothetical protein
MPREAQAAKPQRVESTRTSQPTQSGSPTSAFDAQSLPVVTDRAFVKVLPQQIATLQRAIGNQQVASLLGRNARPAQSSPSALRVGPVNDRYEAEADQVARQVVSGGSVRRANPAPTVAKVQKSPEGNIQRKIDVEEFQRNTNKGTLRRRGDILTAIDTRLKQYAAYPVLIKDEAERAQRKDLLRRIGIITTKWIERHDVTRMDSVSNSNKTNERADRLAAIVTYLKGPFTLALAAEDQHVTQVHSIEIMDGRIAPINRPDEDPERAKQMRKMRKYEKKARGQSEGLHKKFSTVKTDTGKFFGTILPTMMRLLAPGPGDLGKFDFQLEFPLDASGVPWFVGGRLYLESEAKESNEFKAKFKGAFRTGPKIGAVKAALETGVQLEAQAQSPEEVSKLFDWGLYRRFRESKVIPRGITNELWGGSKGTLGYMNSEEWASGVEKDVFNTGKNNEKAYVDLGFYGAGQVEGSVGVAKLGGEAFGYKGRKYTKHTLDVRKGGVGKTEYSKKGAQKSAGQGSHRYELMVKAGVKPWAGDVKLKYESVKALPTQENLTKGTAGSYRPHKYELEANAQVALPLGGNLAQIIATTAGPGIAKMIRDVAVLVQARKANKETGKMGTSMFIGQLGELATGFETNVEYNQIQGSGMGSELGQIDTTTGERVGSDAAQGAGFESGFRFRLKVTKEFALDRSKPGSFKIEGSLYAINIMGGDIYGNKIKLDRATRIGQLKWEKDKKIKFELFGIAGLAEKKKDNPGDPKPTWHKPKYQKYEAPVKPAPRP